jgi:hypothetical protein
MKRPDAATLRRLAVTYEVDPRSIVKEIRLPGSVRGMSGERARRAVRALEQETEKTRRGRDE